ncbi:Gfo/Idh/MocA family oxidoreductase [Microbacterium sp. ET2]|uniref:Gfo/Idh/MocA family protein n=1 Tax=Microbacterium albipurpureum TaxID=3050384 RepID=UPI00259C85B4|nr:Gfo/Idh/MocA family oxidoreductase [Microbacterium sp. ET2 (Ac-2212)]WJL96911.1 Gfo/Idh/MocA family oxidoreductase [Microbacterium sp. ET2 (Ac-2212)]
MSRSADDAIDVALIGLGNSGRHYHLPHLREDPRYRLRVIATSRADTSPDVDADADADIEWVHGWQRALDVPHLDLVVVATPHDLHHPITAAALDRGCSVLVEKPLTVTVAEADDLIARAATAPGRLFVHHQRRWEADFLALEEVVRSGELGRPWRISATRGHQGEYRMSTAEKPHVGARTAGWAHRRSSGGGVLRVIGPHPIDHVLRLAGSPPLSVHARTSIEDGEDVEQWAGIDLDFAEGLTGRVDIFRRLGAPAPRFAVWGESGMAIAPTGDRVDIFAADGTTRSIRGLTPPGTLGAEIYDDIAAALHAGVVPRITVDEAREVVRVIELAERSARSSATSRSAPGEPGDPPS